MGRAWITAGGSDEYAMRMTPGDFVGWRTAPGFASASNVVTVRKEAADAMVKAETLGVKIFAEEAFGVPRTTMYARKLLCGSVFPDVIRYTGDIGDYRKVEMVDQRFRWTKGAFAKSFNMRRDNYKAKRIGEFSFDTKYVFWEDTLVSDNVGKTRPWKLGEILTHLFNTWAESGTGATGVGSFGTAVDLGPSRDAIPQIEISQSTADIVLEDLWLTGTPLDCLETINRRTAAIGRMTAYVDAEGVIHLIDIPQYASNLNQAAGKAIPYESRIGTVDNQCKFPEKVYSAHPVTKRVIVEGWRNVVPADIDCPARADGTWTFTSGSDTVLGVNGAAYSDFTAGQTIRVKGSSSTYTVKSVDSANQITLTTTFAQSTTAGNVDVGETGKQWEQGDWVPLEDILGFWGVTREQLQQLWLYQNGASIPILLAPDVNPDIQKAAGRVRDLRVKLLREHFGRSFRPIYRGEVGYDNSQSSLPENETWYVDQTRPIQGWAAYYQDNINGPGWKNFKAEQLTTQRLYTDAWHLSGYVTNYITVLDPKQMVINISNEANDVRYGYLASTDYTTEPDEYISTVAPLSGLELYDYGEASLRFALYVTIIPNKLQDYYIKPLDGAGSPGKKGNGAYIYFSKNPAVLDCINTPGQTNVITETGSIQSNETRWNSRNILNYQELEADWESVTRSAQYDFQTIVDGELRYHGCLNLTEIEAKLGLAPGQWSQVSWYVDNRGTFTKVLVRPKKPRTGYQRQGSELFKVGKQVQERLRIFR